MAKLAVLIVTTILLGNFLSNNSFCNEMGCSYYGKALILDQSPSDGHDHNTSPDSFTNCCCVSMIDSPKAQPSSVESVPETLFPRYLLHFSQAFLSSIFRPPIA